MIEGHLDRVNPGAQNSMRSQTCARFLRWVIALLSNVYAQLAQGCYMKQNEPL